jgi:LacI family transcriptional regulator
MPAPRAAPWRRWSGTATGASPLSNPRCGSGPPDARIVVLADPTGRDLATIERALTAGPLPTAILVDGNRLLAGAFEIVRRRGLRVPADVAVVALDAVEPLAAAMPEMVGIVRDFAEIGQCAGRLILERLSGARTGRPVRITLASRSVLAEGRPAPSAVRGDPAIRC